MYAHDNIYLYIYNIICIYYAILSSNHLTFDIVHYRLYYADRPPTYWRLLTH